LQVEEVKGILEGMSETQQDPDVKLGVVSVNSLLGDNGKLVALAQQCQASLPQASQAPASPVLTNALLQTLANAQVQHLDPQAIHPAAAPGQVQLQVSQEPHPLYMLQAQFLK
jgi:hypothetical protein